LNLTINTHDITLPPDLRTYAEKRVGRLDRHFDRILDAHLQFDPDTGRGPGAPAVVSLRVHVAGSVLKAEVSHTGMREGIDRVIDKMDGQLRRRKERLTDHGPRTPRNRPG
jgi:putative sigma-54 modulation protein